MAEEDDPNIKTKPKSSCGCCVLKIFALCFVLFLVVCGVFGYYFFNTVNWVTSAAQPVAASYTPLNTAPGEKEDADRVILKLQTIKNNKEVVDETITTAVFNGIMDKVIQDEKAKNAAKGKSEGLEALRLTTDGDHFGLALTSKYISKDPKNNPGALMYLNINATFDLEIEDGQITKAHIEKLVAGGQEAPAVVKFAFNLVLKSIRDGTNTNKDIDKAVEKLHFIKLLKRDGDRLHVILDPSAFQKTEAEADTATTPAPPKKESF